METFVTAYLVVWFSLMLYMLRMGLKQRELAQQIDELLRQLRSDRLAADDLAEKEDEAHARAQAA
ncbi:MAG: CcmD family protein [Planctomycetes bacterium]|nr:CcmD family protein [Planctomycetota bacterium]